MEHRSITGDALPVKRKPHHIPEAWHKEVNTQIQEVVDNRISHPSASPWNAPIILVKKRTTVCVLYVIFLGLMMLQKRTHTPATRT